MPTGSVGICIWCIADHQIRHGVAATIGAVLLQLKLSQTPANPTARYSRGTHRRMRIALCLRAQLLRPSACTIAAHTQSRSAVRRVTIVFAFMSRCAAPALSSMPPTPATIRPDRQDSRPVSACHSSELRAQLRWRHTASPCNRPVVELLPSSLSTSPSGCRPCHTGGLIVEPMRQLMADGRSHVAVVGGVVFLVAIERR